MQRRSVLTAAAIVVAAALGGCAALNTVTAEVATYGDWPAGRAPGRYAFERLPSQQAQAARQAELENAAARALEAAGFTAAPDAAQALKLTARDLQELKLVDDVIPEPLGGAHQDHAAAIANLRKAVVHHLDELAAIPMDRLIEERYQKFRRMGFFAGE